MALNNIEMTEQLFEAIDAIVTERLRTLPYDKMVVASILKRTSYIIDGSTNYKYRVSTDDNIQFDAYSSTNYSLGTRVYVRIPQGDYTLRIPRREFRS